MSCRKQQIIIKNKYKWRSLQFNNVRALNEDKGRYISKSKQWVEYSKYVEISINSASKTLKKECRDIDKKPSKIKSVINTLILYLKNSFYEEIFRSIFSVFKITEPKVLNQYNLHKLVRGKKNIILYGISERYSPKLVKLILNINSNIEIIFIDTHAKSIIIDKKSYRSKKIKNFTFKHDYFFIITNKKYKNEMFDYLILEKYVSPKKIYSWQE